MKLVSILRHAVLAFESAWVDTSSVYIFETFISGYSGNFNHMGIATSRGNGLRVLFVFAMYGVYLIGFGVAHMLLRGRHAARIFVTGTIEALLLFLCDLIYNLAVLPNEEASNDSDTRVVPDATSNDMLPWTLLLASAGFAMQNEVAYYTSGTPVVTLITVHSQNIVMAFLDRWVYSDDVRIRKTVDSVQESLVLVIAYIIGCLLAGVWVVLGQRASPWAFTPIAFIIAVHTLAESIAECISPPDSKKDDRTVIRQVEYSDYPTDAVQQRENRRLLASRAEYQRTRTTDYRMSPL